VLTDFKWDFFNLNHSCWFFSGTFHSSKLGKRYFFSMVHKAFTS